MVEASFLLKKAPVLGAFFANKGRSAPLYLFKCLLKTHYNDNEIKFSGNP